MTASKTRITELAERIATLEAENLARKEEVNRLLMFVGKQTDTLQQLTELVVGRR